MISAENSKRRLLRDDPGTDDVTEIERIEACCVRICSKHRTPTQERRFFCQNRDRFGPDEQGRGVLYADLSETQHTHQERRDMFTGREHERSRRRHLVLKLVVSWKLAIRLCQVAEPPL